jgi:lysophospholipase L1-like esterase
MGRRLAYLLTVVTAATAALAVAAPPASADALPANMAAIGDSITRAYDDCCSYGDHPAQSWSTGVDSTDGITSHAERIAAHVSGFTAYNDAVTGSKMSAGPGQASTAAQQGAQYVTVLLGANDLCTSSPSTMTDTTTFTNEFTATLDALQGVSHVFVSSIPDIYQLYSVLKYNLLARTVWSAAKICQSMLALGESESDRQKVVARETAFNGILASVCGNHANCKWDGGATYATKFSASQVSTLDYFHPNKSGQAVLANVTWAHSFWPTS